jgi:multiple sugar transport system permease protein
VKFIPRSILNSFLVAIATAALSVLFGSFTAYTLSRVRFRGSRSVMVGVLAIRMLPPIGLIVPIYLILDTAHLIDSLVGLAFTYTAFMLPYSIWILYLYFEAIPMDMEDAARIDGCSRFQTVFKIVMPLSIPGITACSLFNLLMVWNEFFLALIITKSVASYTLPVIVSMFTQTFIMQPFDLMLAAAVLGFTVPLILALFFQRYIVSGLTMGAFK